MKWTALCLALSFAGSAHAQLPGFPLPFGNGVDPTEDIVTLRDGTMLHGHVVVLRPGDHVEMMLIDGRTENIPWDQIATSAGPSFPAAERKRPGARYLAPAEGRVPVEISAPRSITIGVLRRQPQIGQESMTFDDDLDVSQLVMDWQSRTGVVVCDATPCRIYARPGPLKLQVSGDNVLAYSAEVTVPPDGARLQLRAPNARQRGSAGALLGASVPLLILGLSFTPAGAAWDQKSGRAAWEGMWYGMGSAMLAAGVGTLISGIVMIVKNKRGVQSISPLGARF